MNTSSAAVLRAESMSAPNAQKVFFPTQFWFYDADINVRQNKQNVVRSISKLHTPKCTETIHYLSFTAPSDIPRCAPKLSWVFRPKDVYPQIAEISYIFTIKYTSSHTPNVSVQ